MHVSTLAAVPVGVGVNIGDRARPRLPDAARARRGKRLLRRQGHLGLVRIDRRRSSLGRGACGNEAAAVTAWAIERCQLTSGTHEGH